MAGPNMKSLNCVIDFIKDVLFNNLNYDIEDLFFIRVRCDTIIEDGDQDYLLNQITQLLNESLTNNIKEINYILSMSLYYNNILSKRYFRMENGFIIK